MTDKPNGNQAMPPMPKASNLQQAMRNAGTAPVSAETTEAIASIMMSAEAQIARVIRLGEYARDHGDYIAEKCGEYARMARTNAENFASELLASEGRRRDEIAKLIGKK
ncbi:MAG TPA: hypothetical protein VLL28_08970 [Hyphomicrobiaceae bacterium]|nr:hypothetical protein [Hyphomicrobiaceae bacterium]